MTHTFSLGKAAIHLQARSQWIGNTVERMSYARTSREVSRVKQDESEHRGDCAARHSGGEECSQQRANGGGALEKHTDPDVEKPFVHIGGSRAGRSHEH